LPNITAHDLGRAGRPPSLETRKRRLHAEFVAVLGGEANITPLKAEAVRAAVAWSAMAAEAREKLIKSGAASTDDAIHTAKLEELAAQAVARLKFLAPQGTRAVA
jgi:hypothetical protein